MRKVESHQQGPPAKMSKPDEVLAAHCKADLVTECMKKKKKTLILSGDFRFRFSAENDVRCRFRFVFGRKWNFIFVSVYGRK